MTNIEPATGASSMMFHAAAHVLEHDPHTGDFGLGFFGNALESGAYFVDDPQLGPLCFLCDLDAGAPRDGGRAAAPHRIVPRDAYGIAVFLEPLGLYLTSQCGTIAAVVLPATDGSAKGGASFSVAFSAGAPCEALRLVLTKTAKVRPGTGFAVEGASLVRGAYEVAPVAGGGETIAKVTYTL